MLNILKITFSIIGIIIGAGFASGQEIYSFFYSYGLYGILGIILASILLGITIYKTLIISKKYKLNSYNELLDEIIKKNKIKQIIKIIINIFLITSFYVMVAGFSAYFKQVFNFNKIISSTFLIIICYFTFNKNVDRIIKINTILVPIIIIIFLIFGIKNIQNINNEKIIENKNIFWVFSAIIYTSYNSITLIGLTGVMNKYLKNKKECFMVAIITTIIIASLAIIIYGLLTNIEKRAEIPMLQVSQLFGGIYKYLYNFTILIAIFTTAISEGYSFLENISKNNKKIYKIANLLMCMSAIPISMIGFSNLVNTIYPIFGVIGLIQIANILLKKI